MTNHLFAMIRHRRVFALSLALVILAVGCEKRKITEIVIKLPDGFSGQVQIQMGVVGAPKLTTSGQAYVVSLPSDGHLQTSTIIEDNLPARFENSRTESVWGYANSISKTGDGIPVGGSIDFFVGTKQQYETQEAHKHKSEFLRPNSGFRVQ